jgi:hypothetical protein
MWRVWEAPSISWSPFQITPKRERELLLHKWNRETDKWKVDNELPSQSKRKAWTESNRSFKFWTERRCEELISKPMNQNARL